MRSLVLALAFLVAAASASAQGRNETAAAQAQFPGNAHIGLAPPPGMAMSHSPPGFEAEDRTKYARIFLSETDPEAFARLESGMTEAALAGIHRRLVRREYLSPTRLLVVATYVQTFAHGRPEERTVEIDDTTLLVREAGMTALVIAKIERGAADLFPASRILESLESVVLRPPIPLDTKIAALRHVPPEAPLMSARAADHVVAMVNGSDERIVVTRAGDWQREDLMRSPTRSTVYSNVATGVSVHVTYDEAGRFSHVRAWRYGAGNANEGFAHAAYTRTSTGERDTLLGETCEIWRAELDDPPPRDKTTVQGCTTGDGIDLWRRMIMPDGDLHDFYTVRALSLERRGVDDAEARPPGELLDWRRWPRQTRVRDRRRPNHEVRLTGSDEAQGLYGELVIRRRAGWTRRDFEGGLIDLSKDVGGPRFSYRFDEYGRLQEMTISAGGAGSHPPRNRFGRAAGEICQWHGRRWGGACTTLDGVILHIEGFDGVQHGSSWSATSVRRGVVAEADMQHPAEALAWFQ